LVHPATAGVATFVVANATEPALPALKEAAKDPDRNISLQANRAIRMIEMGTPRGKRFEPEIIGR